MSPGGAAEPGLGGPDPGGPDPAAPDSVGLPIPGLGGEEAARFFSRLAEPAPAGTPGPLLLLDYDGTLAPFKENPAEARVYPGVEARLGEIFKVSRLVIVTGRSLASILTLLKIDPLPEIWASHGREHRLPGGEVRAALPHEDQREGLRAGREALGAARIPGRVEEKPFSVAFHVRGLERGLGEESMARVREIWFPLIRGGGLEIFPFNGGLELRAPGRSKGDAVSELIGGAPGTPVAYLGDDETDEDAFRALGERGLCVLVRGEWRPTLARVWLRPPGELMEFLGRWLEACRRI